MGIVLALLEGDGNYLNAFGIAWWLLFALTEFAYITLVCPFITVPAWTTCLDCWIGCWPLWMDCWINCCWLGCWIGFCWIGCWTGFCWIGCWIVCWVGGWIGCWVGGWVGCWINYRLFCTCTWLMIGCWGTWDPWSLGGGFWRGWACNGWPIIWGDPDKILDCGASLFYGCCWFWAISPEETPIDLPWIPNSEWRTLFGTELISFDCWTIWVLFWTLLKCGGIAWRGAVRMGWGWGIFYFFPTNSKGWFLFWGTPPK